MKQSYTAQKLNPHHLNVIVEANQILEEYADKGFDLTLRQLYYQFVSRGLIANNQREYKNLGTIVNDGRMVGLIDWDHIVDRTRNLRGVTHWTDSAQIIKACADSFRIDKWAAQKIRPEVWIEKDALIGVIEGVCRELDVDYFSCRGYVSQSEMRDAAASRYLPRFQKGKQGTAIIHLGDHDSSGIDMSRDIQDRLDTFGCAGFTKVIRIALNMDQVQEYQPPPNPAKITDPRAKKYIAEFGDESWELDALTPEIIAGLIRATVANCRDEKKWKTAVKEENEMRKQLTKVSDNWDGVTDWITRNK